MSETSRGDFRREFLGFDAEYLSKKLGTGVPRLFDAEATQKAIGKAYWDAMGAGDLCKDECLEEAFGNIESELEFTRFVEENDDGWHFSDCAKYSTHEQQWLDHLTTVTLPRVRAVIQAELDAETRAA